MAAHPERLEQLREETPPLSPQPFPAYGSEGPAPSALDLWRRLIRRWDIIAAAVAFGLIGAGLYLQLTDKQYDASAYIVTSRSQLVTTLFQAGGGQSADPERDVNTNLEVIASETIAARVRSQLNLGIDIPQLLDRVKVVTKGNSNVFTITARDPQPARSAAIANAFAKQYVRYQGETTRSQFTEGARTVQRRLEGMTPEERASTSGRALSERLQQLQIAASVDTSDVRILDEATPPSHAAVPKPKPVLLIALVVSLFLGTACAAGMAVVRDSRRGPTGA
jgi:uncharacterized protein involved in exopolysaccharide biosynthesis